MYLKETMYKNLYLYALYKVFIHIVTKKKKKKKSIYYKRVPYTFIRLCYMGGAAHALEAKRKIKAKRYTLILNFMH